MKTQIIAASTAALMALAGGQFALAQAAQGPTLVGAQRAAANAERALNARAIDLELDRAGGRLVYEMELVKGGKLYFAHVDALDGKVLRSGQLGPWRNWMGRDWIAQVEGAQPLSKTLATVAAGAAQVTDVDLDRDNGGLYYHIDVVDGGVEKELRVDVRSGAIVTAALDD